MTTTPRLKDLLASGEFILAPGVFEMFSARMADRMGFRPVHDGLWRIGIASGAARRGPCTYPDMVGRARTIAEGTSTPLIADADTGFGGLSTCGRRCAGTKPRASRRSRSRTRRIPKKCGHTPNRRVVPLADAVRRIEVAVDARRHDDTLIIARTDARTGLGLDEAIRRGKAFAAAGADIVFVEAPESPTSSSA